MAYTNGNLMKSVDWITIAIYLVLVIMGWFSICGASYDYADMDFFSFESRAGKQMVWMGCSVVLGFVLSLSLFTACGGNSGNKIVCEKIKYCK